MIVSKHHGVRKSLKDLWNAYLVQGAVWDDNDIPFCPTEKIEIPLDIINWREAVTIHRKKIKIDKNYKCHVYVGFYLDDYLFDGQRGIWNKPDNALEVLKHFDGIISPDFSTNIDFPKPIKFWNTYRMRSFGYWCSSKGINVINNVRWSFDTFEICFKGIPKNSIICLGVVASGLKKLKNRPDYEKYLNLMVAELQPKIILVVGSANYDFFKKLQLNGIIVKSYPSRWNKQKAIAGDNL